MTCSLTFDPSTDLRDASEFLARLRASDSKVKSDDLAAQELAAGDTHLATPDILVLYEETDQRHRSRRFLQALSTEPELLVELAEKPALRNSDGSALSPASLRAVYRNLTKTENRLLAEGRIKAKVVVCDWSHYDRDGAGRYALSPSDRKLLDLHLDT
jgi:hypothetical protein